MGMVKTLNKIIKGKRISNRTSYYPFLHAVKELNIDLLSKRSPRDLNNSLEKLFLECRNYLERYSDGRYVCRCKAHFFFAEDFYKHVLSQHFKNGTSSLFPLQEKAILK